MPKSAKHTNASRAQTTDELKPCPACRAKRGVIVEVKGARFPFFGQCKACGWLTDFVKLRGIAVKRWNEAKRP